jgi:hypothetical protein
VSGYAVLHLDDVPAIAYDEPDQPDWKPLRHHLGVGAFGINAWTAKAAGEHVIERHDEVPGPDDPATAGHQEVYVVLRGRATFTLDGEELDAPAGTFVLVEPAVHRRAVAAEPDTAVLALGGAPDFVPGAGEWIDRARPYVRTDPQRARAILDELRAARPASPGIAIGEALLALGQGDEPGARRWLDKVLARAPSWRDALVDDPDLGPLVAQSGSAS